MPCSLCRWLCCYFFVFCFVLFLLLFLLFFFLVFFFVVVAVFSCSFHSVIWFRSLFLPLFFVCVFLCLFYFVLFCFFSLVLLRLSVSHLVIFCLMTKNNAFNFWGGVIIVFQNKGGFFLVCFVLFCFFLIKTPSVLYQSGFCFFCFFAKETIPPRSVSTIY